MTTISKQITDYHRLISRGPHWAYGFLRRRDLDEQGGYAYEEPDGDIVLSLDDIHKNMMMLECREDPTGQKYISICRNRDALVHYMRRLDNEAYRIFIRHHDKI